MKFLNVTPSFILSLIVVLGSVFFHSTSYANKPYSPVTDAKIKEQVQQAVQKFTTQGAKLEIYHSPIPNFYEVSVDTAVIYVSTDYKHLFYGSLIDIDSGANLTDSRQQTLVSTKLSSINKKDMIVFKAPKEKYIVKVFTDVDCGFCRRLHAQMPQYLKSGITIEYLAFPRAGLTSKTYNKMQNVWCAKNKNIAMDRAKSGKSNPKKKCNNPINEQYEFGKKLGIRGTPSLFLPNGTNYPGYIEPDKLLDLLEQTS